MTDREIKFRGVRDTEDGGIEIVYGDLSHDRPGSTAYYDTHPYRICWRTKGGVGNAPIRKGTVMQFTGLKDRNGKDIYEGDIISSPHFKDAAGRSHALHHICEWSDHYHAWFLRNQKDQTPVKTDGSIMLFVATRHAEFEVVGSIYENPELLEQSE